MYHKLVIFFSFFMANNVTNGSNNACLLPCLDSATQVQATISHGPQTKLLRLCTSAGGTHLGLLPAASLSRRHHCPQEIFPALQIPCQHAEEVSDMWVQETLMRREETLFSERLYTVQVLVFCTLVDFKALDKIPEIAHNTIFI